MNVAIADDKAPSSQTAEREIIRQQLQQWFDWMDTILDIHRNNYVFREATPLELEKHKILLERAIRYCNWLNLIVAEPGANQPDLTRRLNIRIRQLQDAYDTFHDSELSAEEAERALQQVFPE
jgi:hypothetical protein